MAQEAPSHSRLKTALNLTAIAVRTTDVVVTCHNLANGGHEDWLPTQSCAGAAALIGAGQPLSMWFTREMDKRGHSNLAWGGRLSFVVNLAALAYTFANYHPAPRASYTTAPAPGMAVNPRALTH
jgi:hypothetical protein